MLEEINKFDDLNEEQRIAVVQALGSECQGLVQAVFCARLKDAEVALNYLELKKLKARREANREKLETVLRWDDLVSDKERKDVVGKLLIAESRSMKIPIFVIGLEDGRCLEVGDDIQKIRDWGRENTSQVARVAIGMLGLRHR